MKNPLQLRPETAHFRAELDRAQVDELFRRMRVTIWGMLLSLGVMYFALAEAIERHPLLGRLLQALFVLLLLRATSAFAVARSSNVRLRFRVYLVGSTLTALGFATLNIMGYPLLAPTDVALLVLMDAGVCSAALLSMGVSFLVYSAYMVPNLGSLCVAIALNTGTRWTHSLLALTTIYLFALIVLSLQQAMAHQREIILRMQMAEMALRDNLTKLRNRRALVEFMLSEADHILRSWRIPQGLAAPRTPTSLGILMIDMDHFKEVNDTYGHAGGDAVLAQLAAVLSKVIRKPDLVVRWGGEEFVIVARETDRVPPSRLAERVREAVEQHAFVLPSGETLRRTCSIGYAMFPFAEHMPALLTWEQVIAVADLGMYSAKTLGRNRCIGVLAEADFSTLEAVDELLVKGLGEAVAHHRVVLAT